MATQNPVELEGTFPLPEAQLDRFLIRLDIGYPAAHEEAEILVRFRAEDPLVDLKPVATDEEIMAMQKERQDIRVEESIRDYIVAISRATREHDEIDLGASPRASLSLYQSSQAWAALRGRDFVLPDDVKFLAPYVLLHRLMISPRAQLRGRETEGLLQDVIAEVPVPVEN
jgi:MoxR-like ATPase